MVGYLTTARAATKTIKQAMPNAVAITIHPEWSSFATVKNGGEYPGGRSLPEFDCDMTDGPQSATLEREARKQAYLFRRRGGRLFFSIAGGPKREYQKFTWLRTAGPPTPNPAILEALPGGRARLYHKLLAGLENPCSQLSRRKCLSNLYSLLRDGQRH